LLARRSPPNLGVELAREGHHDDVERLLVRHAAAVVDDGLDAQPPAELRGLFPASVHHDDSNADLRTERDLLAECDQAIPFVGDLAAELHDEGPAAKPVDVGKRLAQRVDILHPSTSNRISF
jgi:hypothetical protein